MSSCQEWACHSSLFILKITAIKHQNVARAQKTNHKSLFAFVMYIFIVYLLKVRECVVWHIKNYYGSVQLHAWLTHIVNPLESYFLGIWSNWSVQTNIPVDLPAFTCCHISYIRRVRIHMLCDIKMYGETSNTVCLCLLSIWYPTLCNFPCSLESSTLNISSLNRWCSLMALISCIKHFCSHSFSENHKQQFWRPPSANWKCLYSFTGQAVNM